MIFMALVMALASAGVAIYHALFTGDEPLGTAFAALALAWMAYGKVLKLEREST